jgi:hypothetical protein
MYCNGGTKTAASGIGGRVQTLLIIVRAHTHRILPGLTRRPDYVLMVDPTHSPRAWPGTIFLTVCSLRITASPSLA